MIHNHGLHVMPWNLNPSKFMVMISLLCFVSKNGSVTTTHRLLFTSVHLYRMSVNRTSVKIFICFVLYTLNCSVSRNFYVQAAFKFFLPGAHSGFVRCLDFGELSISWSIYLFGGWVSHWANKLMSKKRVCHNCQKQLPEGAFFRPAGWSSGSGVGGEDRQIKIN